MECVSSMKTESYWVMFVVDQTTRKFVPAPVSRCGCPAGLGGCSHLRAEYAIFSMLQSLMRKRKLASRDRMTMEEALQLLPPSMHNMRKTPIPLSYAF